MIQIGQLIKHLSSLNPQASPARLALYNYMQHFYQAEHVLTADTINQFFADSLEYPHWQQNKNSFGDEVRRILESLIFSMQSTTSNMIEFDRILWPQSVQLMDLENFNDFAEVVHNYLNLHLGEGQKFRLINENQKRLIAVILEPSGAIQVRTFDRKMIIRNGALEPLRKYMALYYDANLVLRKMVWQRLELAPYTLAHFEILDEETVVGTSVRGYLFQKLHNFKGGELAQQSKLFCSIKRLEQYFVDRSTDPYYNETIQSVERAIHLLRMGSVEDLEYAQSVLARSEGAAEQIFIGDNVLPLLIKDLQNQLQGLWQKNPHLIPQTKSVSIN